MTTTITDSDAQRSTTTSKRSREAFDFYRVRVSSSSSRLDTDETSFIEDNIELYRTVLKRLELARDWIPAEDVLGDLDSD